MALSFINLLTCDSFICVLHFPRLCKNAPIDSTLTQRGKSGENTGGLSNGQTCQSAKKDYRW